MQWEYTTITALAQGLFQPDIPDAEIVATLNRYGASGWELVSVVPVLHNGYTSRCLFVLKRPRQQQGPVPALPITE
jgi:hypothetical protein